MAAELAGRLAVGCSCPVCGSVEHPSPAMTRVTSAAPTRRRLASATRPPTSSGRHVQELVTTLESQLAGRSSRSQDRDTAHWERRPRGSGAHACEQQHRRRARGRRCCEDQLDRARGRGPAAAARREMAACARARSPSTPSSESRPRAASDQLDAELDALLADHPGLSSVAALVRRLTRSVQHPRGRPRRGARPVAERDRARAQSRRAAPSGRGAGGRVRLACSRARRRALRRASSAPAPPSSAARRSARAAAEAVLADETVRWRSRRPAPDLAGARRAGSRRPVAPARRGARDPRAGSTRASERLDTLVGELAARSPPGRRSADEHALVAGLAALVEGKSADNQLRMRLSAYVLSERLRQVVAAANERLGAMTDERYTPRAGRREAAPASSAAG